MRRFRTRGTPAHTEWTSGTRQPHTDFIKIGMPCLYLIAPIAMRHGIGMVIFTPHRAQ